jgi:hypothetical protein
MGPAAEKTRTQKIITTVGLPVFVAALVAMVFDQRFGWSLAVPAWLSGRRGGPDGLFDRTVCVAATS